MAALCRDSRFDFSATFADAQQAAPVTVHYPAITSPSKNSTPIRSRKNRKQSNDDTTPQKITSPTNAVEQKKKQRRSTNAIVDTETTVKPDSERLENAVDELLIYFNDENQVLPAETLEQVMSELSFADNKGYLNIISVDKMTRVVKVLEFQVNRGESIISAENFPENLENQTKASFDVAVNCAKASLEIMTATNLAKDVAEEDVSIKFSTAFF